MGKFALLAVAAFALYGTQHSVGLLQARHDGAVETAESEHAAQARSAARAGFARARVALSQSFQDTDLAGDFGGAAYDVEADVTGDVAVVRATGRSDGPRGPVEFVVIARLEREEPTLPETLEYAFLVDDDLSLGGSSGIEPEPPTVAGDVRVHTNADLSLSGAAAIDGTATFSGAQTAGTGGVWAPPVAFEPVDADRIAAAYGVDHDIGPTVWADRTIRGGPADAPVVYRVRGTLEVHNVRYRDHVIVIVEGDLIATDDLRAASGPKDRFAAYITNGIELVGNTQVEGQFVANRSLSYAGTIDIIGSMAAGDILTATGSATFRYRPATSVLAVGFDGAYWTLKLLAYAER